MNYVVLDTDIILRYPKLLGLRPSGITFLVPLAVLQEIRDRALNRGDQADRRLDLIERADQEGAVIIINTDAPKYRALQENIAGSSYLSGTDAALLAVALNHKTNDNSVSIATNDKEVQLAARKEHISLMGESEILQFLGKFPKREKEKETLLFQIYNYEIKARQAIIWQSLAGLIFSGAATIIGYKAGDFFSRSEIWVVLIVLVILGFVLFLVRERYRLVYGVIELLIGIIVIFAAILPGYLKIATIHFTLDLGIKISGGLYIMVRGQDNIIKAIKDTPLGIRLKEKYGIGK